ncbi:histidine kinase [Dechloromonas denitrificans]|uniref:Histidine kinase n=1 Tax=Dechloromonas denitrificans TaxID=281362 RepID=A0A133XJC9_9RHOO|nr:response regulator [Dechloromonas denitrificans]KXB31006.1 histidine kinase [Dechloromonas denitrificans]
MKTNDAHRVPPEILVVDDTVASLDLLCDLLTEAGYVVRPAQDGRMALRSAQAKPPELILLDVRMPGMDGYELCQRLKAEPATRDIPIIFLSALRDTGDKVRGFSLGAVDYIAKPFQPEEVLARVHTHIELRRLQTKLEDKVAERTEQLRLSEQELRDSRSRLQELASFLQTVREEERTAIARELHDELGQALTALRIDLGWLKRQCSPLGSSVTARASDAHALVERTIDALRRIAEGLRPGMLDVLGLAAALEHLCSQFAERTGIACQLKLEPEEFDLDEGPAITVFRLIQEALTNVARHAKASQIEIEVHETADNIHIDIRDNGIGLNPVQSKQGFGLLGMRERVSMLGGRIEIASGASQGVHIVATLPRHGGHTP